MILNLERVHGDFAAQIVDPAIAQNLIPALMANYSRVLNYNGRFNYMILIPKLMPIIRWLEALPFADCGVYLRRA